MTKRVRRKTKLLNYGRLGSPGYVSQVTQNMSTPHHKTETFTQNNLQQEKHLFKQPHIHMLKQEQPHPQQQNSEQNTSAHNIHNTHNTDPQHSEQNNCCQDGCHRQMEFSFLCQMLEQQQVLTQMLVSFLRDNGHSS